PGAPLSRPAILLFSFLALLFSVFAWAQHPAKKSSPAKAAPAQSRLSKQAEVARLNNLGVAYMEQQKIQEALNDFSKASALDPMALIPELNRGIAMLNLEKTAPALEILQRLAARDPKNPVVWFNLGLLYRNNNKIE